MVVRELPRNGRGDCADQTAFTYGQSVAIAAQFTPPVSTAVPSETVPDGRRDGPANSFHFGGRATALTASNLSAGVHVLTIAYSGDRSSNSRNVSSIHGYRGPGRFSSQSRRDAASRRYGRIRSRHLPGSSQAFKMATVSPRPIPPLPPPGFRWVHSRLHRSYLNPGASSRLPLAVQKTAS